MSKLAILGLGYVGLSIASAFREGGREIVGFDTNRRRVAEIRAGLDATGQLDPAKVKNLAAVVTDDPGQLEGCREWVIIVQTGLTTDSAPDVSAVLSAAATVAKMIEPGDLVVLSSTVPIGFTEENFRLTLETLSGLAAGADFDLAYAPERFDPGNSVQTLPTITKIISGFNDRALARVRNLYRPVVQTMVEAASIRAAEASRLLENVQRDVNIAFLNDAARILKAWDIDTGDVLAVTKTKWNWLPFQPGLVGGHCIAVHPHYMRQAAIEAGVSPGLTAMVRDINEALPNRIVDTCMDVLSRRGVARPPIVTVVGIAYKENVADVRGSAAVQIVDELRARGCQVQIVDPLVRDTDLQDSHGLSLTPPAALEAGDAVILAIAHRAVVDAGWAGIMCYLPDQAGLVIDLRRALSRDTIPPGVELWRL